jgi:hypothetical protein
MSTRFSGFVRLASALVLTWLLVGCGDKNNAASVPGVEQTKAIAEEGFIRIAIHPTRYSGWI